MKTPDTTDRPWLKPMAKGRRQTKIGALSVAKLIACLIENPSTLEELTEASGLRPQTARNYLMAMHRERCLHVASWDMDGRGGYTRKVWRLGYGVDAKRPAPKGRLEIERAYRERKKMASLLNLNRQAPANDGSQREAA
jgi:DNA-binding IclR family transcriptional regulator